MSYLASTIYENYGEPKSALCVATVTFNKDNSVSVSINGRKECDEFCGANASLEIDHALSK